MKKLIKFLVMMTGIVILIACKKEEEDEGMLPNIGLKSGGSYINSDVSRPGGSTLLFGINASKAEDVDVLKKFNISKSVNGNTAISVYDKDLSGADGDIFMYDFTTILDTVVGTVCKYTFTVTNRDGLTNQKSVSVTVQ